MDLIDEQRRGAGCIARRMQQDFRDATLGSAMLGAAYFSYIVAAEPFPPDIVRFIPIAWLAGAVFGGLLAARAFRSDSDKVAAGLALTLNVPNAVFAGS